MYHLSIEINISNVVNKISLEIDCNIKVYTAEKKKEVKNNSSHINKIDFIFLVTINTCDILTTPIIHTWRKNIISLCVMVKKM